MFWELINEHSSETMDPIFKDLIERLDIYPKSEAEYRELMRRGKFSIICKNLIYILFFIEFTADPIYINDPENLPVDMHTMYKQWYEECPYTFLQDQFSRAMYYTLSSNDARENNNTKTIDNN